MNKRKLGAVLALIAAFALGGVAGGFGMKSYMLSRFAEHFGGPPGRARMGFRLEAMTRTLDLNEAQRSKLQQIFDKHEDERRQVFSRCEPEHRALRDKVDAEIREVLTPEQRRKYEDTAGRFPGPGGPRGPGRHFGPPPPAP